MDGVNEQKEPNNNGETKRRPAVERIEEWRGGESKNLYLFFYFRLVLSC